MRHAVRATLILAGASLLSGCGGFFDDLAAYQGPIDSQPPVQGTDYVAACHTYGCPSNVPAPTNVQSGCKTPLPDGTYSTTGTACPQ